MKYTCFICGRRTLDSRCDWDICPVCFWEDDVLVKTGDAGQSSPANGGLRVAEAQANYILFGGCSERDRAHVRAPTEEEELDPDWKPLPEAVELAKHLRPRSGES